MESYLFSGTRGFLPRPIGTDLAAMAIFRAGVGVFWMLLQRGTNGRFYRAGDQLWRVISHVSVGCNATIPRQFERITLGGRTVSLEELLV